MRRWAKWPLEQAQLLWRRALREHSTPREVAWSLTLGVFSGCTPFVGLHMWIALALATILRKNRLWAFVGSRVSSNVFFVWIAFVEIELGHRLAAGTWVPFAPREALSHGRELLLDWLLGSAIVGGVLASIAGVVAYFAMRRWPPREVSA